MKNTKPFAVQKFKEGLAQIGQRVKQARQSKGMTQYELADYLDVSAKTISAIEVGRVEPSVSQMQAFSAVLEEPIGYFVGEDASSVESKMERVANELAEIRRTMDLINIKKK